MTSDKALDFSKPHVLRNAKEFKGAVAELDQLADADPVSGSEACDRLELLAVLIEAYEDDRNPIDERAGTPQSVVRFMLPKGVRFISPTKIVGNEVRFISPVTGGGRLAGLPSGAALARRFGSGRVIRAFRQK